eukprot:691066-Pyramimonas_sp.AAC.1
MQWRDFRDGSLHPIRIRGDMPLHVRQKKRALSAIYSTVKEELEKSEHWATHKVGANGHKGVLQ